MTKIPRAQEGRKMPIPPGDWKVYIGDSLLRISSQSYQRRAWFNKHAEQTSPDEQICQLLGDYQFEQIHFRSYGVWR
jgi:hypothetical protein